MNRRVCPSCKHAISFVVYSWNVPLFDDSPVSGQFSLNECSRCGFHYYDTPSNRNAWNEFYASHYLIHFYQEREDVSEQRILLNRTAAMLSKEGVSPHALIADIGCGPGHVLSIMRNIGFSNLAGVEMCPEHLDELRKRGFSAYEGFAENLPFEDSSIDALIYGHILEHLMTPVDAFCEMNRTVRMGGYVLVELPDLSRYDAIKTILPIHQFIFEHINHFSMNHVSMLFKMHGFKLVASEVDSKDSMPIMRGLFKKEMLSGNSCGTSPDFSDSEKVKLWMKGAELYRSDILKQVGHGKSVHIWGISYQTLMRLALIGMDNLVIAGLYDIDDRKQNKTVRGMVIQSPALLKTLPATEVVLIGVGPSSNRMHESLVNSGFTGRIVMLP